MKKIVQPTIRKVYGQTNSQEIQQMNTARKINSLLSSGAVSVTGPTQSRFFKQKIQQPVIKQECYVCDENCGTGGITLTEAQTTVTNSKVPNKIGRIVGDEYMVIISADDLVCKRCFALFNQMDRLENDLEKVKQNILSFINRKYKLSDNDMKMTPQPPAKMQRLNSSGPQITYSRKTSNGEDDEITLTRKITTMPSLQAIQKDSNEHLAVYDAMPNDKTIIRQQTTITPVQAKKPQGTPTRMYKCVSCEFKTFDIKEFTPHYDVCKTKNNGFRCKLCRKLFISASALKTHMDEKHCKDFVCIICSINCLNEPSLKKHMETEHPDVKTIETATTPLGISQLYSCNLCTYKTTDKQSLDDHHKKHNKVKPFKCRICAMRFETRDLAATHARCHQPDYFKCGKCSASFPQRELLMKHFEIHKQSPQNATHGNVQQVQQTQQSSQQDLTTQKLLQETIDEALRDTSGEMDPKINFLSCNICSLTFIQENYYNQHMETHKREGSKKPVPTTNSQSLIRQDVRNTNATILHTQTNSMSDADIESMFEKMHSDKVETEGNSNSSEMVITSQPNSVGGISFSITIPQQEEGSQSNSQEGSSNEKINEESNRMGIDMPNLDHGDEQEQLQQSLDQQEQHSGGPVNMPSLDDDGDDSSHPSNTEQIPMDLEEMQNAAESGQIKFIMNEDGHILQLDNHIITTDAEGNQILVQGTDSEQIQQLLQSVGVLQAGEGDGETFQMIQGENNQMIIVQGEGNEAQIIDASMLNEDGHLVIQHNENDELPEGMHIVNEDGVQVPVSIAFSQQQHEQLDEDGAVEQQQEMEEQDGDDNQKQNFATMEGQDEIEAHEPSENNSTTTTTTTTATITTPTKTEVTSTTHPVSSTTGEAFFNIDELMQQPEQK